LSGRVFLAEERAGVGGELELAAELVVLVVVEHAVLHAVADGDGGDDADLEDARAPAVVEQHAGEAELLDRAVDDHVGVLAPALHAQAPAALDDLIDDGLGEPRLDLVAPRLVLEGGDGHGAHVAGQAALLHRLVTLGEAREAEGRCGDERRAAETANREHP
jgi:hypothetical protein